MTTDTFGTEIEASLALNTDLPEGTTGTCRWCGLEILLDQREGGGPGKDWGATPDAWVGNGGIGMDYGCGDNPISDEDGCGGHEPDLDVGLTPPKEDA